MRLRRFRTTGCGGAWSARELDESTARDDLYALADGLAGEQLVDKCGDEGKDEDDETDAEADGRRPRAGSARGRGRAGSEGEETLPQARALPLRTVARDRARQLIQSPGGEDAAAPLSDDRTRARADRAPGTVDVSVVIAVCPAHYRDLLLGRCLRGLAEQTIGLSRLEVILVGDGVELDGSLVPPGLSVRCHSFPAPVGVSRARNQGLRLAAAALVAFMDADGVPHPEWLARLRARLLQEGVAACGGKTLQSQDHRAYVNRLSSASYVLPCAGLGNALFRKEVLEEVGGFDEDLCFSAEEPDLCWRVGLKGHRFAYAADAIVEHRTHKSRRKFLLYGRALRQLERKFGAVLDISRRAELRIIADSCRRAHARTGELTLAQRVPLLSVAWGYVCALVAELAGRPPHIRAVDLTERTLQAQRTVPPLAAVVDGQPLIRPSHVLWWTSERGCCLLNLATRARVVLEDVAAEIWMGLMRGETVMDLRARLAGDYDAAPATVAADLEDLLRALLAQGMLRSAGAA